MKRTAAIVFSLFAVASSAYAEKFLSVSDIPSALATWQGYWCGLTTMTGSAFATCYCAPPKP